MLVTIKFRLDHTWDEYMAENDELLLEDMIDRLDSLKEGIEPLKLQVQSMATIEERAKVASEGYNDDGYSAGLYMGYVVGATEQKAIDDAMWLRKTYKWIKENVECGVHPQSAYGFADRFLKAMKE